MARQPYKQTESLQDMTTRQLRQYIADKADEAQQRLNSIKEKDRTRAFNDLADEITFKNSDRVRKSTSYMSKTEMVEYAYKLRDFNKFDTKSKYAKDTEYTNNKGRYEKFINNRIADGGRSGDYWRRYLNKDGTVSKRGYEKYKKFIQFMNSTQDLRHEFEYMTIAKRGEEALSDKGIKWMEKKINDAYAAVMLEKEKAEAEGRDFVVSPSEFNKKLDQIIQNAKTTKAKTGTTNKPKAKKAKTGSTKIPKVKKPKQGKSQNIKAKMGRKMKESGKIHRTAR